MEKLRLKTVLDFERSVEIGQAPADEVRETVLRWRLAEKTSELIAEEGALEAIERILRLAER